MREKIKFCGLTTPEAVHAAAANQAAFTGFVHHPSSPRHTGFEQMGALMRYVPADVARVAVMVDPDDAAVSELMRHASPTHLQVHKVTDMARLYALERQSQLPLIVALNVKNADDIGMASRLEDHAAHMLFDAASAGSGAAFDWQLLKHLSLKKPWFLAGGLTPENVGDAIAQTGTPMVDVSSGVESAPGKKDAEKIARFYQAVVNASHA